MTASAIALLVTGAGAIGISQTYAQDANTQDTLVQKIAQRFNLNQDEVRQVVQEHRSSKMAQKQAMIDQRLSQLVTDGKITEQQKQLLINKHKEILEQKKNKKESWKNLTPEQRRAEKEKMHQELQNWAEQNGIDSQYLMGFGKGHKRGMEMK